MDTCQGLGEYTGAEIFTGKLGEKTATYLARVSAGIDPMSAPWWVCQPIMARKTRPTGPGPEVIPPDLQAGSLPEIYRNSRNTWWVWQGRLAGAF